MSVPSDSSLNCRPLRRRQFLRQATRLEAAAFSVPLEAWVAQSGTVTVPGDGYGPQAPAKNEATGLPLLELPRGFRYVSFGWTGDELVDGGRTPGAHDGMAAFAWRPDACGLSAITKSRAAPRRDQPALTDD